MTAPPSAVREARLAGDGEPARRRDLQQPSHVGLLVAAQHVGRCRPHPRQQDRERVIERVLSGAVQQVDRRTDQLVEHDIADGDLGEPRRGQPAEPRPIASGLGDDLDVELPEAPVTDVDLLPARSS